MHHNKSFSLSLQKEIEKRDLSMDSEINKAFKELRLKSLLRRSGIKKHKGYPTIALLYLIVLLPFFKRYMSYLWINNCFIKQFDAQKDTYYRFLNHERFNWRTFIYFLALRIITNCDEVSLEQKVLIADDSISPKTGKNMEFFFDGKKEGTYETCIERHQQYRIDVFSVHQFCGPRTGTNWREHPCPRKEIL